MHKLPRNTLGCSKMLVEFSVTNFRSIRDRQLLSLVPTSIRDHASTHVLPVDAPGVEGLLRTAVIYGANAAGKSNFLRALEVMQDIVVLGSKVDQRIPVTPFLLDESAESPTTFEVVFVSEGVKYQYGFSCTQSFVHEEWLFAFPEKRAQKWFYRKRVSEADSSENYVWDFGPSLRGPKKSWAAATRDNALFLTTSVQLKAEILAPVHAWFRNKLRVVVGSGNIHDSYSKKVLGDAEYRAKLTGLLKAADSGIEDLELFDKQPPSAVLDLVAKGAPEDVREEVLSSLRRAVRVRHRTSSGGEIWIDLDDESDGTKKMFACAGPFIDVLENGRVLIIDELNNSLHPMLTKWVIDTFNSQVSSPHSAQMVFSTHATSVLSLDIFRRDQVWFAEKDERRATCIYPLTDFSPRKDVSLAKGYLQGRYGAVPFLTVGALLDGP